MATRTKLKESSPYFVRLQDKDLPFVNSGCGLFDCALGGGYVLGRVANLVGDKSTGKTLLAIEAATNFLRRYPTGIVRYLEAEAAFDQEYAQALGMPTERVEFVEGVDTVEGMFEDMQKTIDLLNGRPCWYVVDSLDSLSDRAESERKVGEGGTYGTGKSKAMSEGFRRLVRRIEESHMGVLVISQIRENIGVTFGSKYTRSGGKALDFYSSHVVWLAEMGKIKRTARGVERVTGVSIKARVTKNKVGLPYREVTFPILFGYGVDDVTSAVEFLMDLKFGGQVLDELRLAKTTYKAAILRQRDKGPAALNEWRTVLDAACLKAWREIEVDFLPAAGKYA